MNYIFIFSNTYIRAIVKSVTSRKHHPKEVYIRGFSCFYNSLTHSCFIITGIVGRLVLCFSAYTNGKKILGTSQPKGSLTAVNGIRFLSMSWVILGHTLVFVLGNTCKLVFVYCCSCCYCYCHHCWCCRQCCRCCRQFCCHRRCCYCRRCLLLSWLLVSQFLLSLLLLFALFAYCNLSCLFLLLLII